MEDAKAKIDKLQDELLKVSIMGIKPFEMFNKATNLPPGILCVGIVFIGVFACILNLGIANYIVHLIGVAYPVWKSFEALGTEDTCDDDTHWLTYWAAFTFFNFIDTNLSFLLNYIPFYFLWKLLFLVWL